MRIKIKGAKIMAFLDKVKDAAGSAAAATGAAIAANKESRRAAFEERLESIQEFLLDGEEVIEVFEPRMASRDFFVFTDKRIIAVDIQGLSGKKIGYTSLPYSKVSTFGVRTAGLLDLDCELVVAFSGNIADFDGKDNNGQYVFNCPPKSTVTSCPESSASKSWETSNIPESAA